MTSTDTPTLWQLPDGELAAALVAQEQALARAYAHSLALLGEATRRGLAASLGYRDEVKLLTGVLRLSVREAKARLSQAEATQPGAGVAQREPVLPATARAVAAGEITAEHVREISALFARCPDWVTPDQRADSERELVALAVQAPPETVRKVAHRIAAYWDQDGKPPGEVERELAEPQRELRYTHLRGGGLRFTGQLDAETGAVLEGLLGPLAKPRPADGTPDLRTTAQRQGDALAEILELAARVDELATQGGERAVVTVTIGLAELERRVRAALVATPGEPVTVEQLRRWACQARLVPAIFGTRGEPLYLGRSTRHATKAQRRALALRDGGCARPGCTRPPKWCTPHHVDPWGHTGPTDIDSLVLVCDHHHRELHHTAWEVRMVGGIPEFIPRPMWTRSEDPGATARTTHPPPPEHPDGNPGLSTTDNQLKERR